MVETVITVEGSGHECDVRIETWLKDLLPRTPGVSRKVVRREFILACREFFERSCAWRVVIGPKALKAGKKRYIMSPYDAYADIVRVLSVELKGFPLRPAQRRPGRIEFAASSPTTYWLEQPDYVRIWPVPNVDVADALTFYVALTPKQTVSHLPRIARTHFYDALLDGALGRLYSHPAKPYSNPSLAQYHLQRFRTAIGSFAGLAKAGFTSTPQWCFPRFGK